MHRSVVSPGPNAAGPVQSLVRIVVGFLFACHGAASLFGVLGGAVGTHGGTVSFGAWPGWWAALIQLIGGVLVALGLFTRSAALICSGSMAYAYFTVHQPTGLLPIENNGEPSVLYAWTFLLLAAFGPGPWALERLVPTSKRHPQPAATAEQATATL
ncbi:MULTISPECIES: DoxX family protein [unclassified Streptomyces]|uniref:DoxX family protein n=1 Tax=unclassified Streptomyces TaxID=2593676 RepID=UPI0040432AB0